MVQNLDLPSKYLDQLIQKQQIAELQNKTEYYEHQIKEMDSLHHQKIQQLT